MTWRWMEFCNLECSHLWIKEDYKFERKASTDLQICGGRLELSTFTVKPEMSELISHGVNVVQLN